MRRAITFINKFQGNLFLLLKILQMAVTAISTHWMNGKGKQNISAFEKLGLTDKD